MPTARSASPAAPPIATASTPFCDPPPRGATATLATEASEGLTGGRRCDADWGADPEALEDGVSDG